MQVFGNHQVNLFIALSMICSDFIDNNAVISLCNIIIPIDKSQSLVIALSHKLVEDYWANLFYCRFSLTQKLSIDCVILTVDCDMEDAISKQRKFIW